MIGMKVNKKEGLIMGIKRPVKPDECGLLGLYTGIGQQAVEDYQSLKSKEFLTGSERQLLESAEEFLFGENYPLDLKNFFSIMGMDIKEEYLVKLVKKERECSTNARNVR